MSRVDGRTFDSLRPVEMTVGFHRLAEGSVLYRAGGTVVLCTASVDESVPKFMDPAAGRGWVTAEYLMHPRANPKRQDRDGRGRAPSGRTQEIQRLVGRALRAAVELDKLGARTITIDCDVLEADGGTRTASITGGFVALALAIHKITQKKLLSVPVLRAPVAAVSAGIMESSEQLLDLCYVEDSKAEVDFNVVATAAGAVIELQGTAEGAPVPRAQIDTLVDLCLRGVTQLTERQRAALSGAGVSLDTLLVGGGTR